MKFPFILLGTVSVLLVGCFPNLVHGRSGKGFKVMRGQHGKHRLLIHHHNTTEYNGPTPKATEIDRNVRDTDAQKAKEKRDTEKKDEEDDVTKENVQKVTRETEQKKAADKKKANQEMKKDKAAEKKEAKIDKAQQDDTQKKIGKIFKLKKPNFLQKVQKKLTPSVDGAKSFCHVQRRNCKKGKYCGFKFSEKHLYYTGDKKKEARCLRCIKGGEKCGAEFECCAGSCVDAGKGYGQCPPTAKEKEQLVNETHAIKADQEKKELEKIQTAKGEAEKSRPDDSTNGKGEKEQAKDSQSVRTQKEARSEDSTNTRNAQETSMLDTLTKDEKKLFYDLEKRVHEEEQRLQREARSKRDQHDSNQDHSERIKRKTGEHEETLQRAVEAQHISVYKPPELDIFERIKRWFLKLVWGRSPQLGEECNVRFQECSPQNDSFCGFRFEEKGRYFTEDKGTCRTCHGEGTRCSARFECCRGDCRDLGDGRGRCPRSGWENRVIPSDIPPKTKIYRKSKTTFLIRMKTFLATIKGRTGHNGQCDVEVQHCQQMLYCGFSAENQGGSDLYWNKDENNQAVCRHCVQAGKSCYAEFECCSGVCSETDTGVGKCPLFPWHEKTINRMNGTSDSGSSDARDKGLKAMTDRVMKNKLLDAEVKDEKAVETKSRERKLLYDLEKIVTAAEKRLEALQESRNAALRVRLKRNATAPANSTTAPAKPTTVPGNPKKKIWKIPKPSFSTNVKKFFSTFKPRTEKSKKCHIYIQDCKKRHFCGFKLQRDPAGTPFYFLKNKRNKAVCVHCRKGGQECDAKFECCSGKCTDTGGKHGQCPLSKGQKKQMKNAKQIKKFEKEKEKNKKAQSGGTTANSGKTGNGTKTATVPGSKGKAKGKQEKNSGSQKKQNAKDAKKNKAQPVKTDKGKNMKEPTSKGQAKGKQEKKPAKKQNVQGAKKNKAQPGNKARSGKKIEKEKNAKKTASKGQAKGKLVKTTKSRKKTGKEMNANKKAKSRGAKGKQEKKPGTQEKTKQAPQKRTKSGGKTAKKTNAKKTNLKSKGAAKGKPKKQLEKGTKNAKKPKSQVGNAPVKAKKKTKPNPSAKKTAKPASKKGLESPPKRRRTRARMSRSEAQLKAALERRVAAEARRLAVERRSARKLRRVTHAQFPSKAANTA